MKKRSYTSDDPEVLIRLKALQPSTLYIITSKAFFLRGFQYYQEERLERFSWNKDYTVLNGTVLGRALYTVSISLDGSDLSYKCNCPAWGENFQCKHVICTLITIINLLSPKHYHHPRQNQERLQGLGSNLLGIDSLLEKKETPRVIEDVSTSPADQSTYQLVIESIEALPTIYVREKGRVIDSPINLPQGLAIFTYRYFSDRSFLERFMAHLNQFGNRYPLIFACESGEIPIEWKPSLLYRTKTELNASAKYVDIRALCIRDQAISEKVHRFWDFVVDPERGTLGRATNTEGWRLFKEVDRFFQSPPSEFRKSGLKNRWNNPQEQISLNLHYRIPLKVFQSIQLNFNRGTSNEILNRLVFKIDHKTVSPLESKHRYRLTIEGGDKERATLRAECRLGELAGNPTSSAFGFFSALNADKLPAPIKALKRQHVLCKTFFNLIAECKKGEEGKVIRQALSNGDFIQYSIKSTARDLLKTYFSAFIEEDARLWIGPEGWTFAPNEKKKEAQLYRIPFECFGPKLFKETSSYYEMHLPAKQLNEYLSILYARLKAADIDLYYHGKPVKTGRWDFFFDAERTTGIDWFEIKPEIRCDGKLVKESVWLELLQQQGLVEKEGSIQIVDANAQKILKSLQLIYKKSTSKNKGKKEIAQVPNLQILDWIALRKEGVQIKLPEADEALIQRLTHFETIEKITTPGQLKTKLRPYQKDGLDWLAFLYQHRMGACLADDMGLGKTLQAISLLAALKERIVSSSAQDAALPHLIVVPPTLLFNWEHEILHFYPDLKIYQYTGKDRSTDFGEVDVVLTTYALVRRDIEKLKALLFHVIIFDEAQAVKNLYAAVTGAVRQLRGRFKLVVTGTPLENHLGEYYSLIDLCLPGLLGNYEDFKSQTKGEDAPMRPILIERTQPFVLRRIKEAVLKELPPKTETDIYLELTPRQKALYQETVSNIQSQIDDAYQNKTHAQAKIIALTAILKLRQLCVSTRLLLKDSGPRSEHSPKIQFLIAQLEELLQEGHSALVFSQFTSGLDLLEEDLIPTGIPYLRLDGSTPTKRRKEHVIAFQESQEASVFLLSLKAGGQGLNLTRATYVFHLDPWWNPAVENQASDRAHRIGQKNKVSITRILMRHTIEEKMMYLKKKKLELYETVMGGAEKRGRGYAISKSDFDFLLG
ncbi:DEAD/DEAH box helicase [Nitrospira defluvii]|nr:DEAD/DEAH box helicase [Nitrospira defluvii]